MIPLHKLTLFIPAQQVSGVSSNYLPTYHTDLFFRISFGKYPVSGSQHYFFYFSHELLSIILTRDTFAILGGLDIWKDNTFFLKFFSIFQMEFSSSDQCGHLGPQGVVCLYV